MKYKPKTKFIAYGADVVKSTLTNDDSELISWYNKHKLTTKNYFLVVGRFVPENNYETMLKEFMLSKTNKNFVLISNVEHNKFFEKLKENTSFEKDSRIKFVGTVYNQELLKKIRENAYAYFHGHEVGGTNPSLLESLASTDLNFLLDVGFNREVAEEGALYWSKEKGVLADLINKSDSFSSEFIEEKSNVSKSRISEFYSWDKIINDYEKLFLL